MLLRLSTKSLTQLSENMNKLTLGNKVITRGLCGYITFLDEPTHESPWWANLHNWPREYKGYHVGHVCGRIRHFKCCNWVEPLWALEASTSNETSTRRAKKCCWNENRMVEETDLEKLPYLDMVIRESFRLHPFAEFLIPHQSMKDIENNGYYILFFSFLFLSTDITYLREQ